MGDFEPISYIPERLVQVNAELSRIAENPMAFATLVRDFIRAKVLGAVADGTCYPKVSSEGIFDIPVSMEDQSATDPAERDRFGMGEFAIQKLLSGIRSRIASEPDLSTVKLLTMLKSQDDTSLKVFIEHPETTLRIHTVTSIERALLQEAEKPQAVRYERASEIATVFREVSGPFVSNNDVIGRLRTNELLPLKFLEQTLLDYATETKEEKKARLPEKAIPAPPPPSHFLQGKPQRSSRGLPPSIITPSKRGTNPVPKRPKN